MVSPSRGSANFQIEHSRLLLVEGNDDVHFFRRIIDRRQSEGIQIIEFGGKHKLGEFLTNVLVPRVRATDIVRIIGVARDADDYYDRAFQSVGNSLRRAGLPVPNAPIVSANGMLDGAAMLATVYIMPDNGSPGDLEALCLDAVRDAPAVSCVDRYFECLQSVGRVPRQGSKARLRAFLSSNPDDPTLLTGNAIAAGVIPWDSPSFDDVHKFLDVLDAAD
jgi:hypothetical protein